MPSLLKISEAFHRFIIRSSLARQWSFGSAPRKPVISIQRWTAPSLLNTSYSITANIYVPQSSAEGLIVTVGDRFGGYCI